MNRRITKIFTTISVLAFTSSTALFVADWNGKNLPQWALDMRWILFDIGCVIAVVVGISTHIVSNREAFRIGIKVGQAPPQNLHIPWETEEPQSSDTGPQPLRGI